MPQTEKSIGSDLFSVEVDLAHPGVDSGVVEDEESTVQMHAPTLLNDLDLDGFGVTGGTTGSRPLVDLMGETRIVAGNLAPTTIRPIEEPARNMPLLVVESNQRTLEMQVTSTSLVIGRSSECDLTLSDELVSRRHARIEQRPDGWYIQDQQSGNGTRLGGERIREARLYHGDVLQVGSAFITFHFPDDTRAPLVASQDATVLRPVDAGIAPGNVSKKGTGKKKGLLLLFLVALLVGGIVGLSLAMNEQPEPAPASSEPLEPVVPAAKATVLADSTGGIEPAVPAEGNPPEEAPAAPAQIDPAAVSVDGETRDGSGAPAAAAAVASVEAARRVDPPAAEEEEEAAPPPPVRTRTEKPAADEGSPTQESTEWEQPFAVRGEVEELEEPEVIEEWAEEVDGDESAALLREASLQAYREGDLDGALAMADASGVDAEGAAALGRFEILREHCRKLFRTSSQVEPVEMCLFELSELDDLLGGGKGKIREDIRTWLGTMYYYLAVKEKNRGNDATALRILHEALRYSPDHEQAREMLEKLQRQPEATRESKSTVARRGA